MEFRKCTVGQQRAGSFVFALLMSRFKSDLDSVFELALPCSCLGGGDVESSL
jgi:hypothetical protein